MLQQEEPSDFVIATGQGATIQQFCEKAFEHANLNWEDHVIQDTRYLRPSEVDSLIGDASKARELLNWSPKTLWNDLAKLMVDADIKKITQATFLDKK
jgi:GDPmannose 4,6-dehydratase